MNTYFLLLYFSLRFERSVNYICVPLKVLQGIDYNIFEYFYRDSDQEELGHEHEAIPNLVEKYNKELEKVLESYKKGEKDGDYVRKVLNVRGPTFVEYWNITKYFARIFNHTKEDVYRLRKAVNLTKSMWLELIHDPNVTRTTVGPYYDSQGIMEL